MQPALSPYPGPSTREGRKTIAVKLQGGIGNQLFQYALAAHLGDTGAFEVCFVGDGFLHDPYGRKSVIHRLDPAAAIHTSTDLLTPDSRVLSESSWPGVLKTDALSTLLDQQQVDVCLLNGYWQDPSYISAAVLRNLRQIFANLGAMAGTTAANDMTARIARSPCAVAVHVRRNDYKHHGICRETYYIDSLRCVIAQLPQADIMVFSDEPNYTGHFLRQAGIPHQLVTTGDDLLDLKLMSECSLHVIANSTFSWWGAYLAKTRAVLYPLPWSVLHTPVANFFPPHWTGIEDAVSSVIEPVSFQMALAQFEISPHASASHGHGTAGPQEKTHEEF